MKVEYPKWVYPPDGSPGHVIETPADWPDGWSEHIVIVPVAEPAPPPPEEKKKKK